MTVQTEFLKIQISQLHPLNILSQQIQNKASCSVFLKISPGNPDDQQGLRAPGLVLVPACLLLSPPTVPPAPQMHQMIPAFRLRTYSFLCLKCPLCPVYLVNFYLPLKTQLEEPLLCEALPTTELTTPPLCHQCPLYINRQSAYPIILQLSHYMSSFPVRLWGYDQCLSC